MSVPRFSACAVLVLSLAVGACAETTAEPVTESDQSLAAVESANGDGVGRPAPPMGPAWVLGAADELGLTAEQRSTIRRIAGELRTENAPLFDQLRERSGQGGVRPPRRADGGPPADPLARAIRENTRAAMEEVRAVLTEEQLAVLRDLRRARPHDPSLRGGGPGAGPPGPGGDFGERLLALADELDLTDRQLDELRQIFEAVRAENEPLVQELRSRHAADAGSRPDPDDPLLVQIRENLREAMERAMGVLTDEQRATLDALRRDRPDPPPPGPPGG